MGDWGSCVSAYPKLLVKNYPPPTHFPEKEMEEIYYDQLINGIGEPTDNETANETAVGGQ